MSKIAIDCDGVLADFATAFVEKLHKLYPAHPFTVAQWNSWNYGDKVSKEIASEVWREIRATGNFWLMLQAYSANVGALAHFFINHYSHDVWIVTSREPTAGYTVAKQTDCWLKACGLNPIHNYLGIVPVANSDDKAGIYRAADIAFSIDDKPETVEQCDHLEGHRAFLLDRPWNQDAKVKRRVGSVEEFLKEVV